MLTVSDEKEDKHADKLVGIPNETHALLKKKAVEEGMNLKDLVAELIRLGFETRFGNPK